MSNSQIKLIAQRYFKAIADNDQAALEALLDPDLVAHSHSPNPQNREMYLEGIYAWHQAFGNSCFTINEQISEGDKVVTHTTLRAVHNNGVFQGLPPTSREVAGEGITILQVVNNRIVELYTLADRFELLQQLGLIPPS